MSIHTAHTWKYVLVNVCTLQTTCIHNHMNIWVCCNNIFNIITHCVHNVYTFMQCAYILHTYEYAIDIHRVYTFTWIYWYVCSCNIYSLWLLIHMNILMYIFSCNMYTHCIHIVYTRIYYVLADVYTLQATCIHIVYTLYTHCMQHVFTLYTHESVFLQCAYQLQIRCIYSVYTITWAYVHTHMQSEYTSACNIFSHMRTYTRAHRPYLVWLPYMVRFSSTISIGP